jgi:hypothetical protein
MCRCSIFSIWSYIKNKNVGNKFRLVTAMHSNGPLPQVINKKKKNILVT